MRTRLAYMLLGMSVGMGALYSYQQYRNGNMKRTYDNLMNKAQKSQGNMM